jgi:hypothetical protein
MQVQYREEMANHSDLESCVTRREVWSEALTAIRAKLRSQMHAPVPEVEQWLERVVQGYFNYFAVPGNANRLCTFRYEVSRAWSHMHELKGDLYLPLMAASIKCQSDERSVGRIS